MNRCNITCISALASETTHQKPTSTLHSAGSADAQKPSNQHLALKCFKNQASPHTHMSYSYQISPQPEVSRVDALKVSMRGVLSFRPGFLTSCDDDKNQGFGFRVKDFGNSSSQVRGG